MQSNYEVVGKKRYYELKPFFEALSHKNISYAVIKGEVLSLFAYGKTGQRHSGDVDILVAINDVERVNKELEELGFNARDSFEINIALSSTHQSIAYAKEADGEYIEVDINHDVFWAEYTGERLDISEFLSDTIEVEIYNCNIKTVTPLKAMMLLTLHHYRELNSLFYLSIPNCIDYKLFCDVYHLWTNTKQIMTEKLHEISSKYKIIPYAYYVLYYTNQVFADTDLEKLVQSFETEEGKSLLNFYGLTNEERKEWKVDFFTRLNEEHVFNFIKDDLTLNDIERLNAVHSIFPSQYWATVYSQLRK
jgi:hypothetical protein